MKEIPREFSPFAQQPWNGTLKRWQVLGNGRPAPAVSRPKHLDKGFAGVESHLAYLQWCLYSRCCSVVVVVVEVVAVEVMVVVVVVEVCQCACVCGGGGGGGWCGCVGV